MNATENEFKDYVYREIEKIRKELDDKPNKIWAKMVKSDLDNILERIRKVETDLDKLQNRAAVIDARVPDYPYTQETQNTTDVNATIDEYLTLYDAILSKVSEKYRTMDIRLKKDIATTIFIRLMQK